MINSAFKKILKYLFYCNTADRLTIAELQSYKGGSVTVTYGNL